MEFFATLAEFLHLLPQYIRFSYNITDSSLTHIFFFFMDSILWLTPGSSLRCQLYIYSKIWSCFTYCYVILFTFIFLQSLFSYSITEPAQTCSWASFWFTVCTFCTSLGGCLIERGRGLESKLDDSCSNHLFG